jgi:electron transfer flavoprotein beta subunit
VFRSKARAASDDIAPQAAVVKLDLPPARQAGRVVTGTPEETARQLVEYLHSEAKII